MNIVGLDVFSRLMMDRIIFLGVPINDYVANVVQAQMLFLDSTDNKRDVQMYVNSPGGSVTAGLGIYDTMQYISPELRPPWAQYSLLLVRTGSALASLTAE